MKRETLDLGDGHVLAFIDYQGERRVGADVLHTNPGGHKCSCWVAFEGRAWARRFRTVKDLQRWKVENEEPLTLSPDIVCPQCGDRGRVVDGKWERIHADA